MAIHIEPDSEDSEAWIALTGDDLGDTQSSTWKVEMHVAIEGRKD